LPVSEQLFRVLKPAGTFILNIKERVANGERSVYVIELILEMRKQGWLWTEEFVWHKKNCYPGKCVCINGCCYGKMKNSDKGSYLKYCGRQFWEYIGGNENIYIDIIEPLECSAKEKKMILP
jgi:DNA modification methylase